MAEHDMSVGSTVPLQLRADVMETMASDEMSEITCLRVLSSYPYVICSGMNTN